jgi:hypothetical protein
MGAAADRKVTEIEATRRGLEADLRELEARLPSSFRSLKSVVGLVLGSTALTLLVLERVKRKDPKGRPAAEVVIRVVREDL